MKWVAVTMVSMFGVVTIAGASHARQESGHSVAARVGYTTTRPSARKVDLNTASIRELQRLPGLGPELAERVVRHRPYRKLDELIARKVLGRKEFARIKERIRVGAPVERRSVP